MKISIGPELRIIAVQCYARTGKWPDGFLKITHKQVPDVMKREGDEARSVFLRWLVSEDACESALEKEELRLGWKCPKCRHRVCLCSSRFEF